MEQRIHVLGGVLAPCGLAAALALLIAMPAQALQPICVNSPENPSVILGLLGAAAAAYPVARARLGRWLRRRQDDSTSNPSQE